MTKDETERRLLSPLLYVEDDDDLYLMTERRLRDKYQLSRARNSRELFLRLRETRFTGILMDIHLRASEFDGMAMTKIIRGKMAAPPGVSLSRMALRSIPIIVVTAFVCDETRQEARKAGADGFMAKPIRFSELKTELANARVERVRYCGLAHSYESVGLVSSR